MPDYTIRQGCLAWCLASQHTRPSVCTGTQTGRSGPVRAVKWVSTIESIFKMEQTLPNYLTRCHVVNVLFIFPHIQVGVKSTPDRTQCLCNHLTLFGSSFFVMPNYVDVSQTAALFSTASKNYVVLALLCAFFALYLVTLLWACYADRKASSKVTLILWFSRSLNIKTASSVLLSFS